MTALQIEFSRERDGTVVTRYTRADGTSTWERHAGPRAAYFPAHDLMHFAVERGLMLTEGFYPLVAAGWDIRDLDGKGPRGRMPPGAILVENLVGLFATELNSGQILSSAELNEQMHAYARTDGVTPMRAFADSELAATRSEITRLRREWMELLPGNSLRLAFEL